MKRNVTYSFQLLHCVVKEVSGRTYEIYRAQICNSF